MSVWSLIPHQCKKLYWSRPITHLANHLNSASYMWVFQSKSPCVLCNLYFKLNGHNKHDKTRGELVVNFTGIQRVIRELCLLGIVLLTPPRPQVSLTNFKSLAGDAFEPVMCKSRHLESKSGSESSSLESESTRIRIHLSEIGFSFFRSESESSQKYLESRFGFGFAHH